MSELCDSVEELADTAGLSTVEEWNGRTRDVKHQVFSELADDADLMGCSNLTTKIRRL